MDSFLFKLTQCEKTGSLSKIFISLGNLIISFLKLEVDPIFREFYTFTVRQGSLPSF